MIEVYISEWDGSIDLVCSRHGCKNTARYYVDLADDLAGTYSCQVCGNHVRKYRAMEKVHG